MHQPDASPKPRAPVTVRRILGNLGYLVRGRAVAALMLVGATVLMARALGPEGFGLAMLVQAYALLMRGVFNFRTFNGVIQYGVPAYDKDDLRTLRRLLRVCHRVDRASSIAATALAVALVPWAGPWMGMGHDHALMLALYSLVLLTTGNYTPDGILRLFDRFDIISWQLTIGAAVTLVGTVIAWWLHAPLGVFVAVLGIGYGVEQVFMSLLGWREYRRRVGPGSDADLHTARMAEFPGLRRFLWVSYWQSNMDLVPKHLATALAGGLLGASDAGLVRLSRQVASVLSTLAMMTRHAVFPDLARSWHQGDTGFARITYRVALYTGGFGLLLVLVVHLFGRALLDGAVGPKFVAAAPLLTLMMLGATFDVAAAPLRSAAYAMNRAGTTLVLYVIGMLVYLALFAVLAPWLRLIGIGLATVVAAAVPMLAMLVVVQRGGHAGRA